MWTEDHDVFNFLLRRGRHTNREPVAGADDAEWLFMRKLATEARTDVAPGIWSKAGNFTAIADEWFLSLFLSLECETFVGSEWGGGANG